MNRKILHLAVILFYMLSVIILNFAKKQKNKNELINNLHES